MHKDGPDAQKRGRLVKHMTSHILVLGLVKARHRLLWLQPQACVCSRRPIFAVGIKVNPSAVSGRIKALTFEDILSEAAEKGERYVAFSINIK